MNGFWRPQVVIDHAANLGRDTEKARGGYGAIDWSSIRRQTVTREFEAACASPWAALMPDFLECADVRVAG